MTNGSVQINITIIYYDSLLEYYYFGPLEKDEGTYEGEMTIKKKIVAI